MADILKRSVHTIRSLESGRLKLSQELAKRIFHETGISTVWLLNGDPTAPPVTGRGEPYTKEGFDRAQAEKIYYDRPNPIFRKIDALGFCARLVAILESASTKKDYYVALYKTHAALDSLQSEFGIDEKLYQHAGPHSVNEAMAVALLKQILAGHAELERTRLAAVRPSKKKQPLKKRRS